MKTKAWMVVFLAAVWIFSGSGWAQEPTGAILANGLGGATAATPDMDLSISVAVDPGNDSGSAADWWLVRLTPSGDWLFYTFALGWQTAGPGLTGLSPAYQGPLFRLDPFSLVSVSDLSPGGHAFFFGVDTRKNGVLDTPLYYDHVSVSIKETAAYRVYGLNFGPYIQNDENPGLEGAPITEEKLKDRLAKLVGRAQWVRTFGCDDELRDMGKLAHAMGLKVAAGAWLNSDMENNTAQMDCLIEQANLGHADLAVIGSENFLRGDLTVADLAGYMDRFRQEAPGVPVSYADTHNMLLTHPEIVDELDVVMVNYYPYWEGAALNEAVAVVHGWHQYMEAIANKKPVMVGETGWPSCGDTIGNAVPSPENAAAFFLNFVSWARANNVDYFYFEAFDEPWKSGSEGPQGACFGIWDPNKNLKPGMQAVFDGQTVADNWSQGAIPGGPGDPEMEFTLVPQYGDETTDLKGRVWHVNPVNYRVAVYIRVSGNWWTKPSFSQPLTMIGVDGSWSCDITTGGVDPIATEIAAFLVPLGYSPPLASGSPTLPAQLETDALASIQVDRTP